MYHTEGFVNKHTMDSKKHIITLALEKEERPWYVWCIVRKAVVETHVFRQVLSFWLQQTLLTGGKKSSVYVQRELNRLGGYLENMKELPVDVGDILLFMLYDGKLYCWDSENLGFCNNIMELSGGVYGYVSEEGFLEQYPIGDFQTEIIANRLELSLLKACQKGEMEDAFFLIWEDKHVF